MRISDWSSDVCSSDLFDRRWVDAARAVIDEQGNQSKVQKKIILARFAARVERVHGPDVVTLPSTASGYRALDELSRGRATFSGSTKAKRSIANRPPAPYGRLTATRPRSEEHTSELQSLMR